MLWTGGFPITLLGDKFDFMGTGQVFGLPMPVLISAALGAVGMQHGHGVIVPLEQTGDAVRAVLRPAEDEHRVVIHALEQLEQQVGFLGIGNGINDVLHGLGGRPARANLNRLGILHRPFDERLDLRRNGCGKQRGVALARAFVQYPAHVGQKSHVEHPVGLVEHEELNLVQPQRPTLQMIEQTSRRGDHDVGAGAQLVVLPTVADAAKNHSGFQIGEARVIVDGGFHLRGEFARGFEDERARAGRVLPELRKDGQAERGGLAGAGLRTADDVASGEHERDGAELDGRRLDVTHRLDAIHDCRSET
jgi:hypothetical protein